MTCLTTLLAMSGPALAVDPGTVISNSAQAAYGVGGDNDIIVLSNTVSVSTVVSRTPSMLELWQYAPDHPQAELVPVAITEYSVSGTSAGPFVPLPPPAPAGSDQPLVLDEPLPLIAAGVYHQGEPVLLRLNDPDQNRDASVRETVLIELGSSLADDHEWVRLTETGPGTGRFTGYLQTLTRSDRAPADGRLAVCQDCLVTAFYRDVVDPDDSSTAATLVDPTGVVFDSRTGQPVDGAVITLLDASRGEPARVWGDDGESDMPASLVSGGQIEDSGGTEYRFPPGRFRFPFVASGEYRLEIIPPPGYRVPSTVSTEILQALPGAPFILVDPGSRGEPFALNPGPAFHMDLPVDPIDGDLVLEKRASKRIVSAGDFMGYQLIIGNSSTETAHSVRIVDLLPPGFRLQTGSVAVDGVPARDPLFSDDGRGLEFSLGDLPAGEERRLDYVVAVGFGARDGPAVNRAHAEGQTGVVSNTAEAGVEVRSDFFGESCIITGEVLYEDEFTGLRGVRLYLEDGSTIVTDHRGRFHFENIPPGVHVLQLDLSSLPAGDELVPAEGQSRKENRGYSRFLDLAAGTLWNCDFRIRKKPLAGTEETGVLLTIKAGSSDEGDRPSRSDKVDASIMSDFDSAWLESASPGFEWLWPPKNHNPPIPSLNVAIRHHPERELKLLLDGRELSPLNFDDREENESGTIALSRWTGVDLKEGDNRLGVVALGPRGSEELVMERVIHYAGPPVFAEIMHESSRLVADGVEPIVIVVKLTDRDGHPARRGVRGSFHAHPPHMALQAVHQRAADPLSAQDGGAHYIVGDDGIAHLELAPSTESGEAVLTLPLSSGERELRIWVAPAARDWILVGLAAGTAGYRTLEAKTEAAGPGDPEQDLYHEGRLAFFTKGRIKGRWLLTLAYDSRKAWIDPEDDLFDAVDPNAYYIVYGDASVQRQHASSARKLYFKLERDQFYALFGDYDTGLTVTELSRYSRRFNGVKTEWRSERHGLTAFASESNQAFVRDEIRGEGTSGLYPLSRRDLLIHSESVVIETRDRFRSEIIVESRSLARHLDYDIDYDDGTLLFKEPVPSKDANLNAIYIVVEYESADTRESDLNFGGRGSKSFLDRRLELGASYLHEGDRGHEAELAGVDFRLGIGENNELRAEYASSTRESADGSMEGSAHLVELERLAGVMQGRLYLREQDQGFGLGHQNLAEAGTRKLGLDVRREFGRRAELDLQTYRIRNLTSGAERDQGELGLAMKGARFDLRGGLRFAEDRGTGDRDLRSLQILGGAGLRLPGDRLRLRMDHERSLADENANPDFPTRTILGADLELMNDLELFGEHEITSGDSTSTRGSRIGLKSRPWAGAELSGALNRRQHESGERVFASMGLKQSWRPGKRWSTDLGLDHSSEVKESATGGLVDALPPASGGLDEFLAVSLGVAYSGERFSWNTRGELHDGKLADKRSLFMGALGEPSKSLSLAAGARLFNKKAVTGENQRHGEIRLGAALRPRDSRWLMLDRMDFITDRTENGESDNDSWRLVNNLNANIRPGRRTQISLLYAVKYVRETIRGRAYSGFTDLVGLESRRNISPRWDISLVGNVLHSWRLNQYEYRAGASLGFKLVENAWLSLGYNVTGFEDEDFSGAGFTAKGPFLRYRFKFDQESARDLIDGFKN